LSRVANRYSKALFEYGVEQKKLDVIESDLNLIKELIATNSEFREMLVNPLIQASLKSKIISQILKNKLDVLTYNFLILLCSKKRSDFLEEVIERFMMRLLEHKGIIKGEIISTFPLDSDHVGAIKKRVADLTGKTVQLEQTLDKNLLGGFIVKVKDTIIDLSVKGQLEKLREKLVYG